MKFKVKPTPKYDKAIYSKSLPMPIHLKQDLIVQLDWCIDMGSSQCFISLNTQAPVLQREPNGKLRLFGDLRKIKTLIADDYTSSNHPVSTLSDAVQQLSGKSLFCKLDCSEVQRCLQMAGQCECLHSNLPARFLHTKDLHQVLADQHLHFQTSCVNIWTQLSNLTIVLTTWTILELQPSIVQILPGTSGQCSNTFAKQVWNCQ